MKAGHVYILIIAAALLLLCYIEYTLPKPFVWKPTFSHTDHQPFGCAVFDDVVSASLPDSLYGVTDQTLYQMAQDSTLLRSILVVGETLPFTSTDVEALQTLLRRGNRVMIASSDFGTAFEDTFMILASYSRGFDFVQLKNFALSNIKHSIYYLADSIYPNTMEFKAYPQIIPTMLHDKDSTFQVLVSYENEESYPYAVTRSIGKGELILVSTPLFFTNYGMLDENNHLYIFRLLTRLSDLPIVRTEAYSGTNRLADSSQTPLRYILSQQALKWGLYMTVIVLLLFMFFTARRRQRVIPVIHSPKNHSLDFMKLIGTLYFQRKDHRDLVLKKYIYFAESLKRHTFIDLDSGDSIEDLASKIAQRTGLHKGRVENLLENIQALRRSDLPIEEGRMRYFIDEMNEIINQI